MSPQSDNNSSNILSDVEITGSLTFNGELNFDGQLRDGNISGKILTVGPNGQIKGNVESEALTVHGTVTGDVLVTGKCDLKGSASVVGSLTTKRLVMDDGATLLGQVEITPDTPKQSDAAYEGVDFPPGLAALRNLKQ